MSSKPAIPAVLHQIWYQGEAAIPQRLARFRRGWLRMHPGWTHYLWDQTSMRALVAERYPALLAAYEAFPRPIYRIDACRYAILDAYGGLYVDLDVECFRPVDDLLAPYRLVLSRTIGYNNAVIGSVAGHALWTTAMAHIARQPLAAEEPDMAASVVRNVGPGLLSRSIRDLDADRASDTLVCPAYVFEPGTPYLDDAGRIVRSSDMLKSYACHHMDMRWLPQPRRAWSIVTRRIFAAYFSLKQAGRRHT